MIPKFANFLANIKVGTNQKWELVNCFSFYGLKVIAVSLLSCLYDAFLPCHEQ